MKHLILIITLAVLLTVPTLAQDVKAKQSSGDFGLMFDLGGLANLALNGVGGGQLNDSTTFAGGFGAKWYLADKIALRPWVGFQNTSTTTKIGPDSLGLENSLSTTTFSVAPSLLFNIAGSGPVVGYVGGALQFVMQSTSPDLADSNATSFESSFTSFGVGAIMGAEWFPWSNLGLSAEYTLSFSTTSGTVTTTVRSISVEADLPSATFIGIAGRGTLMVTLYM